MHPYNERENNWLSSAARSTPRATLDIAAIEALARAERSRAIGDGIAAALRFLARGITARIRSLAARLKAKPVLRPNALPRAKA